MQMQWKITQPDDALVRHLQQQLKCHPITATVLANRGMVSPEQAARFMQPKLDQLPSPGELKGMQAATQRIYSALQNNEKILVFGDYDADGVTATALLVNFLRAVGAQVVAHIPHRIDEGYGLQPMHINQLATPADIRLIITVDCGSSSHPAVAAAKRFGIDVIVTDHHNIDIAPEACAVINPKLPGQPEALSVLAGVGVAFYLVIALRTALREQGWWKEQKEPNLKALCDLVAIGTIADMVPLTGVNRILVKAGLDQINTSARPGIVALRQVYGNGSGPITSEDISFRLTPRINAAGRMAHAGIALELLNATAADKAQSLAETLDQLNTRRQSIERDLFNRIVKQIENRPDLMAHKTLLLADPGWHEGVLGIVASRLAAQFHRPVILLATNNDVGKGSGRSVPAIDLFSAISQCADLLVKFGGHRQAAGLTVKTQNIGKLQAAFETAVAELASTPDTGPCLTIDAEIRLNQITPRLMNELAQIEPFGETNPAPLFMASDIRVVTGAIVGQRHRRMTLVQSGDGDRPIDAIQFNLTPDTPRAASFGQLAFRLQWNRYNDQKKVQLVVEGT
jgi:single-stranded-DNA-specific exonuclease